MTTDEPAIDVLSAAALRAHAASLHGLLADAILDNASVGYVWPLDEGAVAASWRDWIGEVERGERIVLAAREGLAEVAGCVHLVPCGKPNQPHRGDVQKLLVHRRFRGRGLGRALMDAVEGHALALGRTLLVLDTRTGSAAETLYRRAGWTPFGVVPGFALDPDGTPADCTFFWKRLDATGARQPPQGAS